MEVSLRSQSSDEDDDDDVNIQWKRSTLPCHVMKNVPFSDDINSFFQ